MTEILSPCGSRDSLIAAVRAGADAVYFGGGNFNARRNAKNFTNDDLRDAIQYAKMRGVKVYITLNTLLADSELQEAIEFARFAAECGADAFIVQDLGLAKLLKSSLPEIPLHASTQMTVHSVLGLEELAKFGFCRVVVSREVDKSTLIKICEKAKELNVEIEAFVHGALCMCMSGQCLLSSVIGGRSGNRGMCAQPCRLPFSVSGGSGYDLSLRDLSLIQKLNEMKKIGVTSFKIEGRMKRAEYVAAATAAARFALDTGYENEEISKTVEMVFSRNGFTDGYYENRLGKEMFGRRTEKDIDASESVLSKIHALYRLERASIPLDMKLTATDNLQVTLYASDGQNTAVATSKCEKAQNRATEPSFVIDKLKKLGGTPYYAGEVTAELSEGLAISSGVIKELREKVCEELNNLRIKSRKVLYSEPEFIKSTKAKKDTKFIARFRNIDQIPDSLSGVSAVILPVECDFSALPIKVPVFAELPRGILGTEEKVAKQIRAAKDYIQGLVCSNIGAVELAKKEGLPFVTDIFMNIYNSESAEVITELGAEWYSASVELGAEKIATLPYKKAFFAYGRLPVMLTRNCPNKNGEGCGECNGVAVGTDRLKNPFPMACRNGFSEIFNTKPHYLLDRIDEFSADYAILYFTFETSEEVEEILNSAIKKAAPKGDFTRGLYYRTVL